MDIPEDNFTWCNLDKQMILRPSAYINAKSKFSSEVSMEEEYSSTQTSLLLDKQISRSDGVKSNRNNNGQTNVALLVHCFISCYAQCGCLVFLLVEEEVFLGRIVRPYFFNAFVGFTLVFYLL